MFTGIITSLGTVRSVTPIGTGHDMCMEIGASPDFIAANGGMLVGASIACSGCCLTATAIGADAFTVDVSAETLSRTALATWQLGTRLNLERSLRFGDELGGHLVSGHVDGVGTITEIAQKNASRRLTVEVPAPLHRFIAEKGSVAVDGVSLTVNAVRGQSFGVNVIPHTTAHTTLGLRSPGDPVHIEIDTLARYVARLTETA